jgi:hypothetical protein
MTVMSAPHDSPKCATAGLQELLCSQYGNRYEKHVPQAAKGKKTGLAGCRSGPLPSGQELRARQCAACAELGTARSDVAWDRMWSSQQVSRRPPDRRRLTFPEMERRAPKPLTDRLISVFNLSTEIILG